MKKKHSEPITITEPESISSSVYNLILSSFLKDPAREIQKVAQFLGFKLSESVLSKIVQHTSFESMKANPMTNYTTVPSFIFDQTVSPFMRKGKEKGWASALTCIVRGHGGRFGSNSESRPRHLHVQSTDIKLQG